VAGQFRFFQLLDELYSGGTLAHRDFSSHLGIALGLVNSYIKNLEAKGYITVKNILPKRFAYYLTPIGFSEKIRLTYHLFQYYNRIYRGAKRNIRNIFLCFQSDGGQRIVFADSDEAAEIAY